jgi:WhiB family redox-sensing transcriptional regulator
VPATKIPTSSPISVSDAGLDQSRRATSICGQCDVAAECLHDAPANRIEHGIRGGRTEQQRESLIRARRRRRFTF